MIQQCWAVQPRVELPLIVSYTITVPVSSRATATDGFSQCLPHPLALSCPGIPCSTPKDRERERETDFGCVSSECVSKLCFWRLCLIWQTVGFLLSPECGSVSFVFLFYTINNDFIATLLLLLLTPRGMTKSGW